MTLKKKKKWYAVGGNEMLCLLLSCCLYVRVNIMPEYAMCRLWHLLFLFHFSTDVLFVIEFNMEIYHCASVNAVYKTFGKYSTLFIISQN